MIEIGTLLQNRYRVLKQIGQGGMGAVYVATDERFGSTVAVKQTFFDDPSLRKAFEREAHLLNHLRHTALPKVSDHFAENDGQFLVMDFIEGSDISELLQQRGGAAFPVADVLRWADELLDALDYLHTHEPPVVHRDIKPQNLKLTTRGQIVLLDFGLAKGTSTPQTRANNTASVFGYSRSYAPLEQIQGTGTDARSDLYSLAATLYHMLTGTTPVDALTRASAIVNGQPDPLRPAHRAHVQVPAAVGEILRRALSQNAAHRQPTAADMRAALRRAANALPNTPPQQVAATPLTQAKSAIDVPTVLEPSLLATHGQSPAAETRATTMLRQQGTTQGETTLVDAHGMRRQRPHVNFAMPPSHGKTRERKSPAMLVGVALAVVVACALIAFPLMRRNAKPEVQLVMPTATSAPAEGGAQTATPDPAQAEGTRETQNASTASEASPSQAQSREARPAGEAATTNGQPANGNTESTNGVSSVNDGEGRTGGEGSSGMSPNAGASSGRSSGLVIQAPAPNAASDGRSAAAEYDAQRAADLRRRQQQQLEQQRLEQQRPQPHEERFGPPPPPGGGHRPPPRRPPF